MSLFFNEAKAMTVEKVKNEINNKTAVLVDVREPFEVAQGTLNKAINIPLSQVQKYNFDKNKKIYVFCRSGNRSGQAELILRKDGYKVENLGGYEDLKKQGF